MVYFLRTPFNRDTENHSCPFYNVEDRLRAVRRLREQHLSVSAVCQHEGISESALRKWLARYDAQPSASAILDAPIIPEQQRIRQLEEENQLLRQDVAILNKRRPSLPANWRNPCADCTVAKEGKRYPRLHANRRQA